jgi:hypothetical protein
MKAFNKIRKRDINVETGVSNEYGELEFLFFGPTSTVNRFVDSDMIENQRHEGGGKN